MPGQNKRTASGGSGGTDAGGGKRGKVHAPYKQKKATPEPGSCKTGFEILILPAKGSGLPANVYSQSMMPARLAGLVGLGRLQSMPANYGTVPA
jgi:hypothetical protein